MTLYRLKLLETGDVTTGFSTRWHGHVVIATCDHLFLGAANQTAGQYDLDIHGQAASFPVRRHPTADAAIIMAEAGTPLPRLADVLQQIRGGQTVSVSGFDVSGTLQTQHGSTREPTIARKTFLHTNGTRRTYEGHFIACSFAGVPGLSGAPVQTNEGVIGLYSASTESDMLTGAFHAGHISEIA